MFYYIFFIAASLWNQTAKIKAFLKPDRLSVVISSIICFMEVKSGLYTWNSFNPIFNYFTFLKSFSLLSHPQQFYSTVFSCVQPCVHSTVFIIVCMITFEFEHVFQHNQIFNYTTALSVLEKRKEIKDLEMFSVKINARSSIFFDLF